MSLKRDTISGIKWVLVSSGVQRLLGIVTTIFLARLLEPSDFGLFALAFVLIDGFGLFKSLGVDAALIRQKGDIAEAADTAFWLTPLLGLSLSMLLFLVAPFGAALLGTPAVTPIVRALSAIFVFACLAQVPTMLLQKEMQFWQKSWAEIVANTAYSVTAVMLAFAGFGVWSLVYAYLLKTVVLMGMVWVYSHWKPHLRFRKDLAIQMLQYGKYIFTGSLLVFLKGNLDNVIVGRILGMTALGFYALSYNISNFPSTYIVGKMFSVLFSAFSKLQDDEEALSRAFLKSLKLISMIAIPFGLALVGFSPLFLKVVYGEKWLPAATVLRILAIGGMLKTLGASEAPVFLAKGRSKLDFLINLLHTGVFFALIVPFTQLFGINGAGWVVLISGGLSFFIGMWRVRRILPVSWREILISVVPALIGSSLMLSVFWFLALGNSWLSHAAASVSMVSFFVIGILSGMAYLLSIFLMDRDVRLEVRRIV